MAVPDPLTMTFADLPAAQLAREQFVDCLHARDDARSRTVTLVGDTPAYCLDELAALERRSYAEHDECYGQAALTDRERERLDFSETNVFHARACKAIAEHYGADGWLDYYDVTLTPSEHADVYRRSVADAGSMRMMATGSWS